MTLERFFTENQQVVCVKVTRTSGSAPREAGAEMFVGAEAIWGTIGGGQLEYMAIDRARRMWGAGEGHTVMNVPLGPEIGQCCGGRVVLELAALAEAGREAALAAQAARQAALSEVLIFGAGHVGRALARALAPLPLRARLIDSRQAELALAGEGVARCLTPLPEAEISRAEAGAACVIATHDHALDFLLAAEALGRGDLGYVGMIGSKTKRASFRSWARAHAPDADTAGLTCPMGAAGLGDKRPEVIAAFIVAELLQAVARAGIPERMENDA